MWHFVTVVAARKVKKKVVKKAGKAGKKKEEMEKKRRTKKKMEFMASKVRQLAAPDQTLCNSKQSWAFLSSIK